MSPFRRTRLGAALVAVLVVVTVTGCGTSGITPTSTEHAATVRAGNGDWLLRFTTAEGADGERSRAVYVRLNPTTGAATARALPPVTAADASQDEQVLEVSADHAWAVPDTGVPAAQARTGKLVLYSVTGRGTETLDIRAATGQPRLVAKAWAFDPADAHVLRVVDSGLGVWKVDLSARTAVREATLPKRPGWIYGNGFDKSTGEPYIESIDSDRTDPAGNGDGDVRPVERAGGTLVRYDGAQLADLPKPPCGFAGGFEFHGGDAWLFCADTPRITAYRTSAGGTTWHAFGTPSPKVVPATAADLTFALPPVD